MDQSQIKAKVRQSVGHDITVTFGGNTETVFVVSVDPDGFICQFLPDKGDTSAQFWMPYSVVLAATEP